MPRAIAMKHLKHAFKWVSELLDLEYIAFQPDRKARKIRDDAHKLEALHLSPMYNNEFRAAQIAHTRFRSDALDMMAEKRPHVTVQTYSREAINERKLRSAKHRQLAKELGREWKS